MGTPLERRGMAAAVQKDIVVAAGLPSQWDFVADGAVSANAVSASDGLGGRRGEWLVHIQGGNADKGRDRHDVISTGSLQKL